MLITKNALVCAKPRASHDGILPRHVVIHAQRLFVDFAELRIVCDLMMITACQDLIMRADRYVMISLRDEALAKPLRSRHRADELVETGFEVSNNLLDTCMANVID